MRGLNFVISAKKAASRLHDLAIEEEERRYKFLRSCESLEALDDSQLKSAVRYFERKPIKKGQVVFREGDLGDELFVVESGTVAVTKKRGGGAEKEGPLKVLNKLRKTCAFGEIALMEDTRRTAGITCIGDGSLLILKRDHYNLSLKQTSDKHKAQGGMLSEGLNNEYELALSVFGNLKPNQRYLIKQEMRVEQFPANSTILTAGERNSKLYIVVSGHCTVQHNNVGLERKADSSAQVMPTENVRMAAAAAAAAAQRTAAAAAMQRTAAAAAAVHGTTIAAYETYSPMAKLRITKEQMDKSVSAVTVQAVGPVTCVTLEKRLLLSAGKVIDRKNNSWKQDANVLRYHRRDLVLASDEIKSTASDEIKGTASDEIKGTAEMVRQSTAAAAKGAIVNANDAKHQATSTSSKASNSSFLPDVLERASTKAEGLLGVSRLTDRQRHGVRNSSSKAHQLLAQGGAKKWLKQRHKVYKRTSNGADSGHDKAEVQELFRMIDNTNRYNANTYGASLLALQICV
jgi:CRP-like cAMP-binding protein